MRSTVKYDLQYITRELVYRELVYRELYTRVYNQRILPFKPNKQACREVACHTVDITLISFQDLYIHIYIYV